MKEKTPKIRRDLELIPVRHEGQNLILIRDHLGLVPEGKAVAIPLYRIMVLLDGFRTIRDLQVELMRQSGGQIVHSDEVERILNHLDDCFLLDSGRFRAARDKLIADFTLSRLRPCSHCGKAYPKDPFELRNRLDEILNGQVIPSNPSGKIRAMVAPHIDLAVGYRVYSRVYQFLKYTEPDRVVLLGTGHHISKDLFSLTGKDFKTPLGIVKNDRDSVERLMERGKDIIATNDFGHRAEHSLEFQVIFLQHILKQDSFTIIPILCGSVQSSLPEYSRGSFIEKAKPFLRELEKIIEDKDRSTLVIAGVDFSHVGPKFGHEMPAEYLQGQSKAHDEKLLEYLIHFDANRFWEESRAVNDRFNVCGFSALACLLEVVISGRGEILDYQVWHEDATQSAVGFAGVIIT